VGGEKDLYGILQVEETADETMITKQYRRIALSTHPDKNCFAGAQEAFKLVVEAHSILLDPTKGRMDLVQHFGPNAHIVNVGSSTLKKSRTAGSSVRHGTRYSLHTV
jgi:DnaJ-class molecular chaperone